MTWVKVWVPAHTTAEEVNTQRFVINRLINSGILADDVTAELRAACHPLAAVSDALRLRETL